MISVIISTRNIDESFVNHIKKTSGIEDIEILAYENNGEMSLTQVYNKGFNESKNNTLVFVHDDVEILTKDWGKKLLKHYENEDYGILGVAGSRSIGKSGVWWETKTDMYGCVGHTDGEKTWLSGFSRNFGNKIKPVSVIDGVFISCRKDRIKKTFNEDYDNFHFYDISFSFENTKEDVNVGVIFDISIVHKSVGATNEKWEENRVKFTTKESDFLPHKTYIDVLYPDINLNIKNQKKLAIVIPTKNKVDDLLIPCIKSIVSNTNYKNYNIYIADTGSDKTEIEKTKQLINEINQVRNVVRLIEYNYYNFAKINNDVVKNKIDEDTELILFCNNDIEILNDVIGVMVDIHNKEKQAGTVGCRMHYEDGSIQHLGISLQINKKEELQITHRFLKWDNENIKQSKNDISTHGNTAGFMMVKKDLFLSIGGFNEEYIECFEDVEFNLQCLLKNKKNITTNRGVCYHFESQTRGQKVEKQDVDLIMKFINKNPIIKKTFNRID